MTKVLFLPEVVDQFLELAEVLYQKGYLGFKDVAIDYSEQLFRDIQTNLPLKVKKDAPSYFRRYGNGLLYSSFAMVCYILRLQRTSTLHGMCFIVFMNKTVRLSILSDI